MKESRCSKHAMFKLAIHLNCSKLAHSFRLFDRSVNLLAWQMTSLNVSEFLRNSQMEFSRISWVRISISALRELNFRLFSNWKEYERRDSFSFDYRPNRTPFGSQSKGKSVTTIIFLLILNDSEICFSISIMKCYFV